VPEAYFDNLANSVLSKIEGTAANELQQLSLLLAGLNKTVPFEVSENYFEQVSEAITIQALKEKMPAAFDNINKEHPFEIPVGYFDQLAGNILNKTKEQTSVKVVTMPKRFVAIWKYAAAAVFTGAIALSIYKYTGNTTATDVPVAMNQAKFDETLDNLAEEDIIKYLDKNGTEEDMASLTSGIDEKDLPDQEEYFTDEATLDNFLKDIELKN
jgi:hypothetical protein